MNSFAEEHNSLCVIYHSTSTHIGNLNLIESYAKLHSSLCKKN